MVLTTTMCNESYDKYDVRLKSPESARNWVQKLLPPLKGFTCSKLSLLAA